MHLLLSIPFSSTILSSSLSLGLYQSIYLSTSLSHNPPFHFISLSLICFLSISFYVKLRCLSLILSQTFVNWWSNNWIMNVNPFNPILIRFPLTYLPHAHLHSHARTHTSTHTHKHTHTNKHTHKHILSLSKYTHTLGEALFSNFIWDFVYPKSSSSE